MKLTPEEFLKRFDSLKEALASLRDFSSEEYGRFEVSEKLRSSVPALELLRFAFELLSAALEPGRKVFPFRTPDASMKDDPDWPLTANQPEHLVFKGDSSRDLSVGNIPLKKAVLPIMAEVSALVIALNTARETLPKPGVHGTRHSLRSSAIDPLFGSRFEEVLAELFPEEQWRIASRVDKIRLISIGRSLLRRTSPGSHPEGKISSSRTVTDFLKKHEESNRRHNRFFYSKRRQQR